MSAGAPDDDLCKRFRSTSWARLSWAAFQIIHRSASECLVWFTKPTGSGFGCPPHPSKANPSTNFQQLRRIGFLGSHYSQENHRLGGRLPPVAAG